ncbi:hypothetical protein L3081_25455 [Colwellia sp. MSW7]|uniref:WD40 repeat domain-containing protein n=1 Tax=Colwellia maritima TaxID=2912588 RepID=A0ABS9X7F6_9GAMM|nr:hypothetical protein [Colwellia maritima]MCI2286163.1 hypothetical protein [Colwellia maritima]
MTPSAKGVEMLSLINRDMLLTSNDKSSLAIWSISNNLLTLNGTVEYAENLGTANSATLLTGELSLVAIGHEYGHVSIWTIDGEKINFLHSINVRTPANPSNPWNLHNIRGLLPFSDRTVITGSEDGDLTILDVLDRRVIVRKRYNKNAKLGINNLAIKGEHLLLANCSLGSSDQNLWLYKVTKSSIDLIASTNLLSDQSKSQSYNFDVELFEKEGNLQFFASTEEGFLWYGLIKNNALEVISHSRVASGIAAALDINEDSEHIAVVAHAIRLFKLPEIQ